MKFEKDTTISHYRILSEIGKGGMGEVYLAEDTKLNRKVAIKFLSGEFSQDAERLSRFIQEAKAASALNHPNIITIYEIGESEESRFIALEYIKGETLTNYLKKKLKFNTALDIATQIASALDAAHAAGIVHRDIKPDNVMIRDDGLVKILDFGIAKLTEQEKPEIDSEDATAVQVNTTPGMIIGTANYMSPEQAKGQDVDARTDIFSFGVLLYKMVAGHLPFEGETPMEIIAAIINKEPKPLNDSDIPPEIERIISKALRKNKDERYQTIKGLLADLKEVKQELEFQDKLEKTVQPDREEQKTQMLKATTSGEMHQTATNENLNDSITLKKSGLGKAAVGGLAVLLISVLGLGYWFYSGSDSGQIESIAVLPFENNSGNADSDYLSDGLAESLIYRLSQLPDLKVSPTSSVFRYKGKQTDPNAVARELGVDSVLTGRITERGDTLNISVNLVDTRNGKSLWGEKYERKMSELLATQKEIAIEITNNLKLKLSGESEKKLAKNYTVNPEAYQLYLKGRYYWNKRNEENLKKAIGEFKAAADKDPSFALAFVGLADSYVLLPFYSTTVSNDSVKRAEAYALKALEIDDSLGEAYTSLGCAHRLLWNWTKTEKNLKRGIEHSPNYATAHKFYGNYLGNLRQFDEALEKYKRAAELEPLSLIIKANLTEVYLQKNNLEAAFEQSRQAIELDPNWHYIRLLLALVYHKQGKNAEAIREAEKSVELSKRQSNTLGVLGYIYAQTGKRREAAMIAEELKEKYARGEANGYDLARVYVGLNEKDEAFAWLEKDFQSHNATMPIFLVLTPLDSLSGDPRYKELIKKLNLPE